MNLLKILKGRKLSKKALKKALEGKKEERTFLDSKKITEFRIVGEMPTVKTTYCTYRTTPDASYGWDFAHTGWYANKTVSRTYTPKGLLKEEIIQSIRGQNSFFLDSRRTRQYNPPGRFLGKTIEKVGHPKF